MADLTDEMVAVIEGVARARHEPPIRVVAAIFDAYDPRTARFQELGPPTVLPAVSGADRCSIGGCICRREHRRNMCSAHVDVKKSGRDPSSVDVGPQLAPLDGIQIGAFAVRYSTAVWLLDALHQAVGLNVLAGHIIERWVDSRPRTLLVSP